MSQFKENIKSCIFFALGLALATIGWIYLLHGILADAWRNFEIIASVTVCIFVYSFFHVIIMYLVPFNFLGEKILEFFTLVLLWFVFGYFFNWYDSDNWYFGFIYTVPIYIVAYLFELFTLKRDVDYVNQKL